MTEQTVAGIKGLAQRKTLLLLAVSLGLAALTLLFPSTPSYDPWAWIIWGREVVHLSLLTDPGPSWKPLPILFTAPFALFGDSAPDLWLIIARAGGFLAVWFAFVLSGRLVRSTFPEQAGRWALPPIAAGTIAVLLLVTQFGFLNSVALGNSEGLLIAFALWAVIRHLDGDYRGAFLLGALTALLRPETWPFIGAYGIWLMMREPRQRKLVVAVGVTIPLLWLVPEYIGSGNFFRAADRAHDTKRILVGSLSRAPHPFRAILRLAFNMLGHIGQVTLLFGAIATIWAAWRKQFSPLVIAAAGGAWILLVAAMTAGGYAGNPRYLLLGTSLLEVIAGFGVGALLAALAAVVARLAPKAAPVVVALVCALGVVAVFAASGSDKLSRWTHLSDQLRGEADARGALPGAIAAAGGRETMLLCGAVTTHPLQVPLVAWYVDVPIGQIGLDATGPGTALQTRVVGGKLAPPTGPPGGRVVATVGAWNVLQACPANMGATK